MKRAELKALMDWLLTQHEQGVSRGAGRIPLEHFAGLNAVPHDPTAPAAEPFTPKDPFDGNIVKYLEREYPGLVEKTPGLKLMDPAVYGDWNFSFKRPLDLLSIPAYLTEKGIMGLDYTADAMLLGKPSSSSMGDDEWQRFRYHANPAFRAGASWLHSVWAANDGKKVLMALNPVAPVPLRMAAAKEVIENASKHFVEQARNGHPWAASHPEEVSAMYRIPLDVTNYLGGVPLQAMREAGYLADVQKLTPIVMEASDLGRKVYRQTKSIDKAVAAVSAHLADVGSLSGGLGLHDGSIGRLIVQGVDSALPGVRDVAGRFAKPWSNFQAEAVASQLYHDLGFRVNAPASFSIPFADWWRKPSELHYGAMKEMAGPAMDTMRSYAASKQQALASLDLPKRVKALASLSYPSEKVVGDVLYALKTVPRAAHDVAGSFERGFLTMAQGDSRLGGIPQKTVDLAKDIAVRLGHGWNGHGPWEETYSLRQSVLEKVTGGGAPTLDDAFKTAQSYLKEGKGAFAESAPIKVLANWIANVETRVPRDLKLNTILEELEGVKGAVQKTYDTAAANGYSRARQEAAGILKVADQLRDDLKSFQLNPELKSLDEGGAILSVIKPFNNAMRIGQLFLQPVTALKNAVNSIGEKALASGVAAEDAASSAWAYLRGGKMPAASVDLMGQPLNFFADPALYQTGVAGAKETFPSIFSLNPMAKMTHGENLARQATGTANYWAKVDELTAAFPRMSRDDVHRKALSAASETVANFHFNSDDIPKAAQLMRTIMGYPDFNLRDLGVYLDLAAKYPAQALALGRTLDLYNMATHGNGLRVGTLPGTNYTFRFDPTALSGAVKAVERLTDIRPADPRVAQANADAAGGDGTLLGEMGRAGYYMNHYASQGLRSLAGGFLPHVSMFLHSAGLDTPGSAAPTINAYEAALSAAGKSLFGVEVQTSDAIESALGRNPGEERAAFERRKIVAYAAGEKLKGRNLDPYQAAAEYRQHELVSKGLAMFVPGMKVVTDGSQAIAEKLGRAKDLILSADGDNTRIESIKAQIRVDPDLAPTAPLLPLSPREWAHAAGKRVSGLVGLANTPPPNPGDPAPENWGYEVGTATGPMAAAYQGEPKPVLLAATDIPKPTLAAYAPPDSWAKDPTTGMFVPRWNQGFDKRGVSARDRQLAATIANETIYQASHLAKSPKQFVEMLNQVKDANGTPWIVPFVDSAFEYAKKTGQSADLNLSNLIPAFTAINLSRAGGEYAGVLDSDLPRSIGENVSRMTNWVRSEINGHGLNTAEMRKVLSSPESLAAFAQGKSGIKPGALPQTFDPVAALDPYVFARVKENIRETDWGMAERNAIGRRMEAFPEMGKIVGDLQDAVRNPRKVEATLSNANALIAEGRLPKDFWNILDNTTTYRNLYDNVGVAASFPEAKSVIDRLVVRNRDGRIVDINEAGLFELALDPRMEPLRPYLQAARGGAYGSDISNAINQGVASLPQGWADTIEKAAPVDQAATQAHFREVANLASGNHGPDFTAILQAVGYTATQAAAPKATPPSAMTARLAGNPSEFSVSPGQLAKELPVDRRAWFEGASSYGSAPFRSVSQLIGTSISDWQAESRRYAAAGAPEQAPGFFTVLGQNAKRQMVQGTTAENVAVGAQAVATGLSLANTFDLIPADGDGRAAFNGFMTATSTFFALGGPATAPISAPVAIAAGIYTGLKGGGGGGDPRAREIQEENLKLNRERLELQRQQYEESLRQQSVRDLRQNVQDLARSIAGGARPTSTDVSTRLATFQRRPSYGSKIGLVDALTRSLSTQLKPSY